MILGRAEYGGFQTERKNLGGWRAGDMNLGRGEDGFHNWGAASFFMLKDALVVGYTSNDNLAWQTVKMATVTR